MAEGSVAPKALSVVIASQNARASVVACLASLRAQDPNGLVEIVVVDNSRDGTARVIAEKFPDVRLIGVAGPRLIPELWGLGAKSVRGEVVAFTTAHCVPDERWLAETRRLHQSEHAAIGGAIENDPSSSLAEWAVYFCRYAQYMLPFAPHLAEQVPADNASYKLWALEKYVDPGSAEFWEFEVNRRLHRDGHSLLLTPQILVKQERSFGVWDFCAQRLAHGRIFGAARVAAASKARRVLYLASSPLIPPVFLVKLARQVLGKGRHRREFLLSFPIVTLFVLCWSLGESLGYLFGTPVREGNLA
ncbi:MAG TPA: glycosyltransferase [Chloroflexota bacterium]